MFLIRAYEPSSHTSFYSGPVRCRKLFYSSIFFFTFFVENCNFIFDKNSSFYPSSSGMEVKMVPTSPAAPNLLCFVLFPRYDCQKIRAYLTIVRHIVSSLSADIRDIVSHFLLKLLAQEVKG